MFSSSKVYAQNKKIGSIHKLKMMLWFINGLEPKRAIANINARA